MKTSRTLASIYIPSKGRADNCLTANLLLKEGVEFNIVVEPTDFPLYAAKYGERRLVMLDKCNGGLGYARNWCKKISIERGEKFHWQLDDDVKSFRVRENGKNIYSNANVCLGDAEQYAFKFSNIGTAGLTHMMFAWTYKRSVVCNRQCCSVVLVNNAVPISWRSGVIEDTDYALQLLFRGARKTSTPEPRWCTLTFSKLIYDPMATNSMKGGCTEIQHANGGRARTCIATQRLWPNVLKLKNQYGSIRLAASRVWSKFPQRPTKA